MGLLFQIPVGVLAVTRLGDRQRPPARAQPRLRDPRHRGRRRGRHADARPGDDARRDGAAASSSSSSASCSPGSSSAAAAAARAATTAGTSTTTCPYPEHSMLFDLRGRGRRRTVQVIYLSLAILMGGGLVLFGIGGATSGGLFDAIGGSGGSSTSTDTVFKERLAALRAPAQGRPPERRPPSSGMTKLRFRHAEHRRELQPDPGRLHRQGPGRAAPGRRGLAALPRDQPARSPTPARPT